MASLRAPIQLSALRIPFRSDICSLALIEKSQGSYRVGVCKLCSTSIVVVILHMLSVRSSERVETRQRQLQCERIGLWERRGREIELAQSELALAPSPPSPESSSEFAFAHRTFGGKDGVLGALDAPLFTLGSPVVFCCLPLVVPLLCAPLVYRVRYRARSPPLFLPSKHVYSDARVPGAFFNC